MIVFSAVVFGVGRRAGAWGSLVWAVRLEVCGGLGFVMAWGFVMAALVFEVDQVYDDFYHHFFFYGFAFGDHERESDEGVVSDLF